MARKLKATLSTQSLNELADKLDRYNRLLNDACRNMVRELSDIGIKVAYFNSGSGLGKQCFFYSLYEERGTECKAILIGSAPTKTVTWYVTQADGSFTTKSSDINPLLMIEFGAGIYGMPAGAYGEDGIFMGQGTHPVGGHGTDPNGWWYATKVVSTESGDLVLGGWKHSSGTRPTRPMYHAYEEMKKNVYDAARRAMQRINI